MTEIVITKIDHDSWWGYYIDDALYAYDDYYNLSDKEVMKEAILSAIDKGIIKSRNDKLNVTIVQHTDLPEFLANDELYETVQDEFSSELPPTFTEFMAFVRKHA